AIFAVEGGDASAIVSDITRALMTISFWEALLWLRRCTLLAAWRNDVLQAQVGDDVAVVFHAVHVVDGQYVAFPRVASEELHRFRTGGVGHAVVGFVAVGKSIFE